jgi:hypothetical protein
MLYRVCTLVVWLLLAASGIGWWFEFTAPKGFAQGPVVDDTPAQPAVNPQTLQQLLGARTAVSPEAAAPGGQYQLQGVVTHGHEVGAALIADGNQAPRVYRLGMEVAPGLRVLSLEPRVVTLGPAGGPASQTLHVPSSDANTGTMTNANANTYTQPNSVGSRAAPSFGTVPATRTLAPPPMQMPPAQQGRP